jgi:hypothetical protein
MILKLSLSLRLDSVEQPRKPPSVATVGAFWVSPVDVSAHRGLGRPLLVRASSSAMHVQTELKRILSDH